MIECKRLERLRWKTIAKYGDPDKVWEAEEMVNDLQEKTTARVGKQKLEVGSGQVGGLKKI